MRRTALPLQVLGGLLLSVGLWLVAPALGLCGAGAFAILFGLAVEREGR